MKRDLIIGVVVSLGVHFGLAFGGQLLKPHAKKVAAAEEEMFIEMAPPPIEPEEVEAEVTDEPVTQTEVQAFAPPSLVDAPSQVNFNDFTQALQPPPPPNATISSTMEIPKGPPATGNVGRNLSDVFRVSDLDQTIQARIRTQPVYPYDLKRQGITGSVTVEMIVDQQGNVIDQWVVKSTHREFEQPALQAVQKWKFRPGKKGGKPVKVRVSQALQFNLNND